MAGHYSLPPSGRLCSRHTLPNMQDLQDQDQKHQTVLMPAQERLQDINAMQYLQAQHRLPSRLPTQHEQQLRPAQVQDRVQDSSSGFTHAVLLGGHCMGGRLPLWQHTS